MAIWVSLVLGVGSLLAVAAAQAYLTQGQVRLARLQQQLTTEEAHHRDLELRVAQLEDPSNVVGKAQQQGLAVPAQVTDLPLVTTHGSASGNPATTNPTTPNSSPSTTNSSTSSSTNSSTNSSTSPTTSKSTASNPPVTTTPPARSSAGSTR